MAITLTDQWKQHAFPDDHPAREQVWAEESERGRVETRREVYLEHTTDLRIKRHTSGKNDRADAKAAKDRLLDDMMLLAVGSAEYQAAYDNELSFTIDGEEFEITQGQLYERAKARAEDLQEQIDAARRRGASAEEIARLEEDRAAFLIIRDNADPRLGEVTPDRRQAIDNAITGNASAQAVVRQEGQRKPAADQNHSSAEIADRMDNEARTDRVADEINGTGGRSSFASSIEAAKPVSAVASLTATYSEAANGLPPADQNLDNTSEPAEPGKTPGLSL